MISAIHFICSHPQGVSTIRQFAALASTADGVEMLGRLCKGDDPRNGLNAGKPLGMPQHTHTHTHTHTHCHTARADAAAANLWSVFYGICDICR